MRSLPSESPAQGITRVCQRCPRALPIGCSPKRLYCDACKRQNVRDRVAKWQRDNPEKHQDLRARADPVAARKRAADWYEANKHHAQARSKKWREAHPDKMRAYHTKWMQKPENAAKSKEWVRAWMMAHPEKRRVYYKEWATENAVVLRAYGKRRQELVAQSDFTFDDWLTTLAAFNHCCAYCLRGDRPLTMDHMNPISRGGLHTADNIIPACRSCNSKKGDRSILLMASKG